MYHHLWGCTIVIVVTCQHLLGARVFTYGIGEKAAEASRMRLIINSPSVLKMSPEEDTVRIVSLPFK